MTNSSSGKRSAIRASAWQLVLALTLVTCVLVLSQVPIATWATTATVSLALGASALVLMGAAALLAARFPAVESLLGGLDRVYVAHKWLAVWALAFASFHLIFQAELREWPLASILSLPRPATRLVRQASFVALMLIVMLALNRKIPYHRWRLWHKLSGPLFLIVILHWLSIRSPIPLATPAGIWLALVAGLGVIGAAYKLLLYRFVSPHAEYRVVEVTPGAAGLHLKLEPVEHPIAFEPGQFGFLRMESEGLWEPHPFTIAAGGSPEQRVEFLIRDLGDYTHKLVRETTPGMYAEIYAPYGRFTRLPAAQREIWIAGGVGVSPFIAWLSDPTAECSERITFFYFFTPGRALPSPEVLGQLAHGKGVEYVPVAGGPSSEEFTARFKEIVARHGAGEVNISFCGPKGLLEHVRTLMRELRVPDSHLRYEYFEFR
ncbi:MAG TPA: ferredoxin reductase family protein [Steroidobacteraceae bacterium]|nr:ferredoxin reductase family protein [Steroidobacteraceae bacterium]